jgi:hypothetical protein
MRAREFTINIPINIKINGDGSIDVDQEDDAKDPSEPEVNPVMVSPLQQDLELRKAEVGKTSPIIKKLTQNEIPPAKKPPLDRLR